MNEAIEGYIIGSLHEKDRVENIDLLKRSIPSLQYEEAVYPAFTKVPFKRRLLELSLTRTAHQLNDGELGCLLSHRSVWRKIIKRSTSETQMFLVLESDSVIQDLGLMRERYDDMSGKYDIFFWGAWEGHMKLYRSTRKRIGSDYVYGEPFIKTVYCTYGYSLNKKAAAYLLQQTKRIAYPVDQFKQFIEDGKLRLGGVVPELITTSGREKSYIQTNRNRVKEFFLWIMLDLKNNIICFFK